MGEPSAKKQKTAGAASSSSRVTDPRFANIQSDPRYRLPGKKNKVKLDKRFARVLEDDDFVKRAKVDRYGRPLEANVEKKRLKRKYEFDEDEEPESDEADDDDEVQKELGRVEKKTRDPLREGRETDSEAETSSDETSTDSDSQDEEGAEDVAEELDVGPTQQQDVPTGEVTSRIAIVNLDWDNIRAADLMAVFSSFLPSTGGSLVKVAIYPSEFGKERLEREELEGPPKDIFTNTAKEGNADDDTSDDEEADEDIKASILKNQNGDEDFNATALRKYQLERLRYFYAILTFSSPSVAKHIYDAVDGTEYLRTANFFDLRFVPDDTDFSTDVPREECERIPDDYRPNEFVTDALQHSKVKLTWDAEDTGRKEAVARAFKGGKAKGKKGMQEMIDENDLRAYLASDSDDSAAEGLELQDGTSNTHDNVPAARLSKKEAERQRMRTLLGLPLDPVKPSKTKDQAPIGDMQITFTSGLNPSKDDKKRPVFENSPEPEETTLEKYVRKERERKQKRKEKMKSANAIPGHEDRDDTPAETADQLVEDAHEEEDELGFDDPFFASAEPSAEHSKSTSNKLKKEERLKKKRQREAEEERDRQQRAELELLMADDDVEDNGGVPGKSKIQHFDMREIERAEKQARKKGKKNKLKRKTKSDAAHDGSGDMPADDFQVDTSDPRFARLFSSHEYAIDPTNPRFKGTKNMKLLLDEGRKRKNKDQQKQSGGRDEPREGRLAGKTSTGNSEHGGNVKSLVEKIKRQQKS
ncbi:Pre-rRNA-processing protein esf1 [Cladophialophora carrionii]|uniref:Pre-rRNA-processing protein esf1 n=1 Tax=Cladophialophora carrionii TaxID=86049 RepID=A0A1C1CA25_9EURO|nr:Pre-rRNA-processing protein esf1 [Cladophialophora carrionii]